MNEQSTLFRPIFWHSLVVKKKDGGPLRRGEEVTKLAANAAKRSQMDFWMTFYQFTVESATNFQQSILPRGW